jgi:hypothetical protein
MVRNRTGWIAAGLVCAALAGCGGAEGRSVRSGAKRVADATAVARIDLGCSASQLRVANGPRISEKTEQDTETMILHNVSRSRCTLRGRPAISLLGATGRRLPFAFRDRGDQMLTFAAAQTVVLRAGAVAYVAINKNDCVTRSRSSATRLLLTLPRSSRPLTIRLGRDPTLDYCNAGDPGHAVDISPFVRHLIDLLNQDQ